MAIVEQRKRFTVDEVLRMAEAGLFDDDRRVELIEGDLLVMAPIGDGHVIAVNELNTAFGAVGSARTVTVSVQNPLQLDEHSAPEPDLVLVRPDTRLPTAADALLVIEVADTSLAYDRGRKSALYAAAGVAEYWIVDVLARSVEVRTAPVDGAYTEVSTVMTGELRPQAVDAVVEVERLFGD